MRVSESGGQYRGLEPAEEALSPQAGAEPVETADADHTVAAPPAGPDTASATAPSLLGLLPASLLATQTATQTAQQVATQTAPPACSPPADASQPPPTVVASAVVAFVGEPAVGPAWLAQREAALQGVRADYQAARQRAIDRAGQGPGWAPAQDLFVDDFGQTHSARQEPLAWLADPDAPPEPMGWDEGGAIHRADPGQWLSFQEEPFAAHYRAEAGPALQALAASYGTDVASLLATHPELWRLATEDHALNAGPPPAQGMAMGDAQTLGTMDLYLSDPQVQALIGAYGGLAPSGAGGGLQQEQVRLYGQARFEQLSRLGQAMQSVRDQYVAAMGQAQAAGSGPGWVERPSTGWVSVDQGDGSTSALLPLYATDAGGNVLRGADGLPLQATHLAFDLDTFTAWYTHQGGLQHQAFADFYGQSHSDSFTDDTGQRHATNTRFDNPDWTLAGTQMQHASLQSLDLAHAPRLNDEQAVVFDLQAGWATPYGNLHHEGHWLETVVKVGVVAAVAYVSGGSAGPEAAAAMGLTESAAAGAALTTTGVVVSAGIAGAATSLASGLLNDNLSFKGVLLGALAGGLSAGLMDTLGPWASQAGAAGTVALRGTVQGGIQALLGGQFKDGALAGIAAGLADVATAALKDGIEQAVLRGDLSGEQAIAARNFNRVLGSAIRAVGNPDDPGAAFASAFLGDLMDQVGREQRAAEAAQAAQAVQAELAAQPATLTPAQQALQRAVELQRQGFSEADAVALAMAGVGSAEPVGPWAPADPATAAAGTEPAQVVVVTGQRLPRDPLGNAYETDASGRQVVHLAGGGMLALAATAAVPIADGMAMPSLAALARLASASQIAGGLTMANLLRLASVPGLLLGTSGNAGQGVQSVALTEDLRFELRQGEVFGTLYERQADGQWLAREERYAGFSNGAGFVVLDEEQITRQRQPITTPATPQPPQTTPPLPSWADRHEPLPGYAAEPNAGPGGTSTPGEPAQTWEDLLIERNRAEQERFRNAAIADARLLDPTFNPAGYQAHHIVPLNEYPELNGLRARLEEWGIDLNDASVNGVMLPARPGLGEETLHGDTQRNTQYERAIRDRLERVVSREQAIVELQQIREDLRNGTFIPPKKG